MKTDTKKSVLIFGATGAIGGAICNYFSERDWQVTGIVRNSNATQFNADIDFINWDPTAGNQPELKIKKKQFDAVIWAQGKNTNDNIFDVKLEKHEDLYKSNVLYIIITLQYLLNNNLLSMPSRLCIISSIWQNIARQNKLSYAVTKSSIKGLVQSLMIDLGKEGHLINAVLPGALDTEMTRKNLSVEQIYKIENESPLKKLAMLKDVCGIVEFLCSQSNTGITGQFVSADTGFTNARIL